MQNERGFTYLIVIFLVAVMSIITVRALENILTAERREKESALLEVGQIYLSAIRSYYENSPGSIKQYPVKSSTGDPFAALLLDARTTRPQRHLRRHFRDPVTASKEWGIVYSGDFIVGVYSLSANQPLKLEGFPIELAAFSHAKTYSAWRFIYIPGEDGVTASNPGSNPAGTPN
jgi:type II secretory pathway pseudopilin PulG